MRPVRQSRAIDRPAENVEIHLGHEGLVERSHRDGDGRGTGAGREAGVAAIARRNDVTAGGKGSRQGRAIANQGRRANYDGTVQELHAAGRRTRAGRERRDRSREGHRATGDHEGPRRIDREGRAGLDDGLRRTRGGRAAGEIGVAAVRSGDGMAADGQKRRAEGRLAACQG